MIIFPAIDLYEGKATYIQLTQSYRSTVEIIDFASKALNAQNLGLKDAKPVLRHGDKPRIIKIKDKEEYGIEIDKIIEEVRSKGKKSIALICKDVKDCVNLSKLLKKNSNNEFELVKGKEKSITNELVILPSYLTKGLEFDCCIIINPSQNKYKENILDERLLYVSLTRALHYEYIITMEKITNLI